MALRAEQQKQALVESVAGLSEKRVGDGKAAAISRFVRHFYAHVPPEDVLARSPDDLFGAAVSLWDFARERKPGEAKIRSFTPRPDEHGWKSARTIVEIVNDDMPFLVDSVTAALNALDHIVHLIIHPVVRVRRDETGKLVELLGDEGEEGLRESLMHVEISEQSDPARLEAATAKLRSVLTDVRNAVADWQSMRTTLAAVLLEIATQRPPIPPKEVEDGVDFLKWLAEDNFTFLGYREYDYGSGSNGELKIKAKPGLGILRDPTYSVFAGLRNFTTLPGDVQQFLRRPRLVMITKSNQRATVHRAAHMDAIGIKSFGPNGEVIGERLFLGLFTSLAYSRSARTIPLLSQKVKRVMSRAGFAPASHDGKALSHILDTYPRDELFQITDDELYDIAQGILNLQERQRIALFVRRDAFERFVSCLVYVPRDRFNTELRQRMAAILEDAYQGQLTGFQTQLDDSVLARVHYIIRTTRGGVPPVETAEVERRLVEVGRTWGDRLHEVLVAARGEETATSLMRRFGAAFPASYRERSSADEAIADLGRIEAVLGGAPLALALSRPAEGGGDRLRFKIVQRGQPVALSDILPMLENMDLRVLSEVPHEIRAEGSDKAVWVQDFELQQRSGRAIDVAAAHAGFEEAFTRLWSGDMESDGFNRLILLAGLAWRQVVVLRTYCKVLRQAGSSFSQSYMEDTLARHAGIAGKLVQLFERRFDPAAEADRDLKANGIVQEIDHLLDEVTNLDEDRILRSFLLLVQKTLRTNYYQRDPSGAPKPYLSVKLKSREIELLPLPRPLYEVYVYAPRVEGVHLRGGKVARGGIRWSDRKEDFRSEILGLMKAQMVKNAVIVPVGSKGGFVVKRPPAARDAYMAEGIECYKTLMRGLLDVTDNIVGGKIVHPQQVVRRDDDDPYLVVAADKGTATFSDIANGVSEEYGFWLGDAFASGGSAGYDHKGMGITARGAWETVKRHFRERGTDIQTTDFTCVGVGDMSGDVFGNGMLLSKHIRLVGAFNHMHIFLDPDPDAAKGWAERKRLFDTPRTQWSDYDKSLISKGGGIFERSAKSIALSPEVRACFGIEAERLTPAELIQAMLRAEIDLLWFGGIGTYVKAGDETNAEVGDRGNEPLRINGTEIRAKVVGEGANLGVTQRGRIEYALGGGRINTDAIDNSAGVDTSDHEVNLKVLLNPLIAASELTREERDRVLGELTDEVAELVLRDNYLQGLAISLAERQGVDLLDQQARLIRGFERQGKLDRALEFLPDDETIAERMSSRRGLVRPELAVLLAYAKMVLYDELLPSDLPDDPQLADDLVRYFPKPLIKRFAVAIERHQLRREIIATYVTNSIVNRAGITFVSEMKERSGRPVSDIARAYAIVRDAFDLRPIWSAIDELDNKAPSSAQYDLLLAIGRLVERATLWFLASGVPLDIKARLEEFRPGLSALTHRMPEILPDVQRGMLDARTRGFADQGIPESVANRIARLERLSAGPDIIRLAKRASIDVLDAGRAYFSVGARFGLDRLRGAAAGLRAETPWQKMAVAAVVDDLFALQSEITAKVTTDGGALEPWLKRRAGSVAGADATIQELMAAPQLDLAMLTVAGRQLRAVASA